MTVTDALGGLATLMTISSFIPQAWKIMKTRDTSSISLKMYILTVTGFALWFLYGLSLEQWPLLLTNGLCFAISGFILTLKLMSRDLKQG